MNNNLSFSANAMSSLKLFLRFIQDTVLTAAIYIVLVSFTLLLGYFADLSQEPGHKFILGVVEFAILVAGSLVVLFVLVSLTFDFFIEVSHDTRRSRIDGAGGDQYKNGDDGKVGARLPLIIICVLLLGALGAWEVQQRQIEERVEKQGIRDMALENFAALCRVSGGRMDKLSSVCHLQDGRFVPLRLMDVAPHGDR